MKMAKGDPKLYDQLAHKWVPVFEEEVVAAGRVAVEETDLPRAQPAGLVDIQAAPSSYSNMIPAGAESPASSEEMYFTVPSSPERITATAAEVVKGMEEDFEKEAAERLELAAEVQRMLDSDEPFEPVISQGQMTEEDWLWELDLRSCVAGVESNTELDPLMEYVFTMEDIEVASPTPSEEENLLS